jgi:hypothetical protein
VLLTSLSATRWCCDLVGTRFGRSGAGKREFGRAQHRQNATSVDRTIVRVRLGYSATSSECRSLSLRVG